MATTQTKGRISVTFDQTDEATPVMVHTRNWDRSSTFWCARETGELAANSSSVTDLQLTEAELEWLDSLENKAAACEEIARKEWS